MKDTHDHIETIIRARQGDREAVSQLTEAASQRLSQFVFRLTLQEDLTQDIVQESLVDMLKFFPTLKHTDRFWYWLYGIAYNKIGRHFQRERVRRSVSLHQVNPKAMAGHNDPTVADAISQELRQIVSRSMQQIDPHHRAILTLRCYDQMSYAEIARLMHCTEFSARALFYRAKKALARHLALYGLEKGALLTALVVFGKMTATSKAAAAQMTLSAAALQVGPTVALACTLTGKTAALCTLGVLLATGVWAGAMHKTVPANPSELIMSQTHPDITTTSLAALVSLDQQRWSFYPQGINGPVMLRTQTRNGEQNGRWHILQNAQGNFLWEDHTITYRNAHALLGDSLAAPPTAATHRAALLLEELDQGRQYHCRTLHQQNVLYEDYFQPDWPAGIRVVDTRDAMHKRGWTVVRLNGSLQGQLLQGWACIPFTYAALSQHHPWLHCTLGRNLDITDAPQGAVWRQESPPRRTRFPAGSFLCGLNRPWRGRHCLDDLMMSARVQGLDYRLISCTDTEARLEITCGAVTLCYDIDMDDDLIRGIQWIQNGKSLGDLHFEFYQEIPADLSTVSAPNVTNQGSKTTRQPGLHWLDDLGQKQLTDQF